LNKNPQESGQAQFTAAKQPSPQNPGSESGQVLFSANALLSILEASAAIENEGQLDKALRQTLNQTLALVPGDVAALSLFEPDRSWVKLVAAGEVAAAFEGYRLRLSGGKGLIEKALDANGTVTCDDCQAEGFGEVYQANKINRGVALPLFRQEKALGVLAVFRQAGDAFTPEETALLELFARQVGALLFNRKRLNELDTALKSRDEFLSIASHDLRNPLTALRGFTQLTARSIDKVPPDQPLPRANIQGNLQRIIKQTGSLDKLIGKLLDVSRINTGRLEIQAETEELDELVVEAVNRCRVAVATTESEDNVAAEKRHSIDLEIEHKALVGEFDRERIYQVVSNLLDNAVKYSPDGGVVQVNLHRAGDNFAQLSVKDNGIGIPEEKQAAIFNRWNRVNASNNGEITASGLGLGLFICREIVRKHNGQISLESLPGQGTTFYVHLPIESQV
jgi:signal transduction histidine kinase